MVTHAHSPAARFFTSFAKYAFLIVLGLFFLFPLFAMLSRSLMTHPTG